MSELTSCLSFLGQPHLQEGVDSLSSEEKHSFLLQLQSYGLQTHLLQQKTLFEKPLVKETAPPSSFDTVEQHADPSLGEDLISQGKVGCIILAGGEGSRLQWAGPKGTFPVFNNKSFFQLLFEKIHARSKKLKISLPVAVMVSSHNANETDLFLKEKSRFGLKEEQVSLFVQEDLPLIDERGNWVLKKPGQLATAAAGNGYFFKAFHASGLLHSWKNLGIEHINVVLIDNPLADPFDAHFIGYHANQKNQISCKSVKRLSPQEKMGVFVQKGEKLCVIEYSEMQKSEAYATNLDGSLKYFLANTSLFCFITDFLDHQEISLPIHLHKKKSSELQSFFYKSERFIFDLLPFASKTSLLLYPREQTFYPVKTKEDIPFLQKILR